MVMEIRSGVNKDILNLPMFSDDILKIEISSPDVSGTAVEIHRQEDRAAG